LNNVDMQRTKVYPLGSSRLKKTLPALNQEFDIVQSGTNPIPCKFRDIGGIRKVGTLYRMIAPIIRHQDEVIVVVYSFGTLPLLVGELCNRLDVPFLVRIRGGMWGEFRDRARTNGKSRLRARLSGEAKDYRRELVFARADGILPISRFNQDQFFTESSARISPSKVRVVGNPLETERFDNAPTGQFKQALDIPADDHLALTITSFNYQGKYKGVCYFMPDIGHVLASHPNWHIAIAGGGAAVDQGHEEILSAVPEKVRSRVHLPGFWSPIETALADAEIALHLSYRDAAPMTVLEEQAARLPVIVNFTGGMKNLIDESNAPADIPVVVSEPSEIECPLEKLIKNSSIRGEIGERNRNYVESEFSPATIGAEFRSAINKIIS
jgi:glycosyltransferase involved in cell wall biosynthesis